MTVVSGGIRFIRIFVKVPRGGGVKRECGCRERKFQRFRWRFSYTLDMRPALSYGDMQSVVAFPVTQPLLLANGGEGRPPGPPMPGSANEYKHELLAV